MEVEVIEFYLPVLVLVDMGMNTRVESVAVGIRPVPTLLDQCQTTIAPKITKSITVTTVELLAPSRDAMVIVFSRQIIRDASESCYRSFHG